MSSTDDLVRKMQRRVAQCRRLAAYVGDPMARRALEQMADEGEADLRKLSADSGSQDNDRREAK